MEAGRVIFTVNDGEVIVISDDKGSNAGSEEGGNAGGMEGGDDKIDVEEWRSVFPGDDDDDTGPDPTLTEGDLARKDWLNIHFG